MTCGYHIRAALQLNWTLETQRWPEISRFGNCVKVIVSFSTEPSNRRCFDIVGQNRCSPVVLAALRWQSVPPPGGGSASALSSGSDLRSMGHGHWAANSQPAGPSSRFRGLRVLHLFFFWGGGDQRIPLSGCQLKSCLIDVRLETNRLFLQAII